MVSSLRSAPSVNIPDGGEKKGCENIELHEAQTVVP